MGVRLMNLPDGVTLLAIARNADEPSSEGSGSEEPGAAESGSTERGAAGNAEGQE